MKEILTMIRPEDRSNWEKEFMLFILDNCEKV